jgi:hypothetical protein
MTELEIAINELEIAMAEKRLRAIEKAINNKIILSIEGGVLQYVFSNNDAKVVLYDWDNIKENGNTAEMQNKFDNETKNLKELF